MSTQTCPSRDDLKAFALGTLTADQIAAVGEHLDACSVCVAELTTLDAVGDTLVASLGNLGESDTYERESSLRHALERIEEFGRDPSFTARAVGQPDASNPDDTVGPNTDIAPVLARHGSPGPDEPADRRSPEPADLGTLHDYRLLAKLGEGGMGTVYKALHIHLEKIVALKVLPKERMTDPNAVARFEREIKAVGRLNHPHIVQALDARQIEGSYILALEYVEGMDLNDVATHVGSLQIADGCEVVRQAALGLQAAFEHGLIHRDIKPSNLMLSFVQSSRHTPCAVTSPADGTRSVPATKAIVKILDFGLARLGSDGGPASHGEMTSAGTAMGTADYMAPEQATDSRSVDIRADIYSLGCTLYKLLAGRAPFSGPKYKGHLEKITGHLRDTPPPISLVRSDVSSELAAILERMMAKDRESRFATPQEVFDALAPFAAGADLGRLAREAAGMAAGVKPLDQSVGTDRHLSSAHTGTTPLECGDLSPRSMAPRDIQPSPPPKTAAAGRGAHRRIWIALVAAAAAIPLLFGVWVIVRDKSGKEIGRMQVPEGGSFEPVDDQGQPVKAVRDSQKKPFATPKTKPSSKEADKTKAAPAQGAIAALLPPPDSQASKLKLVTAPAPLKDVISWTIVPKPQVAGVPPFFCEAISPDRRRALLLSHDSDLLIFDIAAGRLTRVLHPRFPVVCVTWSRDSRLIAARCLHSSEETSREESICVWDAETGRLVRQFDGKSQWGTYPFYHIAFSNDSRFLAVSRKSGQFAGVEIWSVEDGELTRTLDCGAAPSFLQSAGLAWTPDDSLLLVANANVNGEKTEIYDVETGRLVSQMPKVSLAPRFSVDGKKLAIGGAGLVKIFDWPNLDQPIEVSVAGGNWAVPLHWSNDGKRLLVGSTGVNLEQIDLSDGGSKVSPLATLARVSLGSSIFYRGGSPGFLATEGNVILLMDLESSQKQTLTMKTLPCRGGPVTYSLSDQERVVVSPYDFTSYRFAWSDDRRWFADASGDDEIQVWDAPAGKLAYRLRGEKPAQRIALAPDGKWLAAADAEGTTSLWDVASEKLGKSLASVSGAKTAMAFSPDGRLLAAGGEDLQFFDVASGRADRVLPIRVAGTGRLLVWSADSRQLTARAADGTLHVVDTERGDVVQTRQGHSTAGAFSADGRLFASRDQTEVIRVTDLASGHMDSVLHFGDDDWVAVSADGHYCGSLGVEEQIAYLVETEAGRELLSPAEFAQKYGWKNDAAQVRCRGDAPPRPAVAKGDAPPPIKVKPGPEFSPLEWCVQMGSFAQQQLCTQPLPEGSTWTLGLSKPQPHKVVRFSPNGELLAVWSGDNWIRGYDRELSLRLMVPGGQGFSFSPDSQFLAVILRSSQGSQAAVFDVSSGKGVLRLDCHRRTASVAWSPDGRMLATGDDTGCVRFWSVETGSLLDTLLCPSPAERVSWSPSGDYLSVSPIYWRPAEKSGDVVVWDSLARIPVAVFGEPPRLADTAWSPDNTLAVSLHTGELRLWSGERRRVLSSDRVSGGLLLAWSPDGKHVVLDRTIRAVPGMAVVRELENPGNDGLISVAWSPDGSLIAGGNDLGDILFWRPNVSKPVRSLGGPLFPVLNGPASWSRDGSEPLPQGSMAFSRDKSWGLRPAVSWTRAGDVASVDRGQEVDLIDVNTGQATVLQVGDALMHETAFSADGKRLAVLRNPNTRIQVWDVATHKKTGEIDCADPLLKYDPLLAYWCRGLALSPNGAVLALGGYNVSIHILNATTGEVLRKLPISSNHPNQQCFAFSPDGSRFAALGMEYVHVFDVATWEETRKIPIVRRVPVVGGDNWVPDHLAWLPDGTSLAYTYDKAELRIADSVSGELLRSIKDVYLDAALFNRDASLLVTPDWFGLVRVFETATGKLRHSFTTYADGQWVATSPDGHWSGSPGMEQHLVHIIQTPEGQQLLSPEEFAKKYGWKNDPAKVALPSEPSGQQPAGTGESSKKADPPQPAEPTQPAEPKP